MRLHVNVRVTLSVLILQSSTKIVNPEPSLFKRSGSLARSLIDQCIRLPGLGFFGIEIAIDFDWDYPDSAVNC